MASYKYRLGPVSAYAIAKQNDPSLTTEQKWLESLTAYGVAKKNDPSLNTEAKFLESLTAYGLAKKYEHFEGTVEEWLQSLHATDSQVAEYLVTNPEILQQMNPMRGSVATMSALPTEGNAVNDTYYVISERYPVTWTGSEWVQSGMDEAAFTGALEEMRLLAGRAERAIGLGWENGGINDSTGLDNNGSSAMAKRIRTAALEVGDYTIAPDAGYDWYIYYYNASNELAGKGGWYSAPGNVASSAPSGAKTFRLVGRKPDGSSLGANIQASEGEHIRPLVPIGAPLADIERDVATITELLEGDHLEWEQGAITGSGEDTEALKISRIRTPMYAISAYSIVPDGEATLWVYFYQEDGTFISFLKQQNATVHLLDAAPDGAEKFRLCAARRSGGVITPDFGSHVLVMGPKNAEMFRRILRLETAVEPYSSNLVDMKILGTATGWVKDSESEYHGPGSNLSKAIGIAGGFPISGGFKPNTQYTVSLNAHTVARETDDPTRNGLLITVKYTDNPNTLTLLPFKRGQTDYTSVASTATTAAGRTVESIGCAIANGGSTHWYIKEFQIEEGTTATPYNAAAITAVDLKARAAAGEAGGAAMAAVNALREETEDALDQITEATPRANLFDENELLQMPGWSAAAGDYSGKINSSMMNNLPNGFTVAGGLKENTRYTVSLQAYNASASTSTSKGMRVTFYYTDTTNSGTTHNFSLDTSSWTKKSFTSEPGKTVSKIVLGVANGSGTTWHIKEMQIEEGATATAYAPPGTDYSAVDKVARQSGGTLLPSGDDDTARILSRLMSGECFLGPGEFHVNGLDMPDNALLRGSGRKTVVRFASGAKNYAIRIGQSCTIRDLKLVEQDISAEAYRPGSDYTSGNTGIYATRISDEKPIRGVIAGVEISGFSHAGIKCWETGVNYEQSISISDCYIHHNNIGIFFDIHGEYNRVTGCAINCNYYGVIANGGNNQFSACGFNGNAIGVLIDGKNIVSTNMAHGSFNGCSFNHSFSRDEQDNIVSNSGVAIKLLGVSSPEIFNGCVIGGGTLWLEDSGGGVFQGFYFGNSTGIKIVDNDSDTRIHLFANCLVYGARNGVIYPTVEVGSGSQVQFVNCYTRSGSVFAPTGS